MKFDTFKCDNIFQNLFTPPTGYQLKQVLITSFTFSKRMLGEVLVAYETAGRGVSVKGMSGIQARLSLLMAEKMSLPIRIYADNVLESISTYWTEGLDCALSGLQQRYVKIIPKELKGEGYFHPKIILVKFVSSDGESLFKVSVSSKNVTYDNFLQLGAVVKGKTGSAETNNGRNLYHFLSLFEADMAGWEALKKTEFYYNGWQETEEITSYQAGLPVQFYFSAPESMLEKQKIRIPKIEEGISRDKQNCEEVLFVSDTIRAEFPYFSADIPVTMVSNAKSWAEAGLNLEKPHLLGKNGHCKVLDEAFPPYIHAKMYAFKHKEKTVVYVGSANCTEQALWGNFEMMIRLEYQEDLALDCLREGSDRLSFRDVTPADIENGKRENELESFFKGFKFEAESYKDGNLIVSWKLPDKTKPDYIKEFECWFRTPNKNKYIQLETEDKGQVFSYDCRLEQLPLNGRAKLHVKLTKTPEQKADMLVDVSVSLDSIKDVINNLIDSAMAEDGIGVFTKYIFQGWTPDVKDAIPPIGDFGSEHDTADIRIAKYMRNNPQGYRVIAENAKKLQEKCTSLDDKRNEGFDYISYNKELEAAKNKLDRLQKMMEEMNTRE